MNYPSVTQYTPAEWARHKKNQLDRIERLLAKMEHQRWHMDEHWDRYVRLCDESLRSPTVPDHDIRKETDE